MLTTKDHLLWAIFSNKAKYDLIDIEIFCWKWQSYRMRWIFLNLTHWIRWRKDTFWTQFSYSGHSAILPAFVIDCDWVKRNEVPWDLKEIPSGHSTRDLDLVASKNIWHGSLLYIDPNIIIIVFDCLLKLHSAVV